MDFLRTIRRYAEFSSAEGPNELVIPMLASGQSGLPMAFDLAPHQDCAYKHHREEEDIGKSGVVINSVVVMV